MCLCTGVAAAAVGNELFSLGLEQLEICCFKQIWLEKNKLGGVDDIVIRS